MYVGAYVVLCGRRPTGGTFSVKVQYGCMCEVGWKLFSGVGTGGSIVRLRSGLISWRVSAALRPPKQKLLSAPRKDIIYTQHLRGGCLQMDCVVNFVRVFVHTFL